MKRKEKPLPQDYYQPRDTICDERIILLWVVILSIIGIVSELRYVL